MSSVTCFRCGYWPCACTYIAGLAPGGPYASLAPVALDMMAHPRPHRGPGETSCPCPSCWSARAATWKD